MAASILALLTVAMYALFALWNVVYATTGSVSLLLENVLGGAVGAGALLVAAGFTFARRIAGAWTLCGLCVLYVVTGVFLAPVLRGTPLTDQFGWIFGFHKVNGVAIGLAVIFGVLTAVTAAIAGIVRSYGPTAATPRRP
ncbi:hypothetical protein [Actinocatenispora rupis]|uniref:Uncharacterized protein n=1 Tax=Actinocatenispora rupis TaxID=519421 RepID=A0A8J3JCX7_9ACTN|nr:hypothetical protein [Actinocatenispora rupis]GID16036.1 hypothetical protein Aru02nite_69250 [Actinocatenispora rupis]